MSACWTTQTSGAREWRRCWARRWPRRRRSWAVPSCTRAAPRAEELEGRRGLRFEAAHPATPFCKPLVCHHRCRPPAPSVLQARSWLCLHTCTGLCVGQGLQVPTPPNLHLHSVVPMLDSLRMLLLLSLMFETLCGYVDICGLLVCWKLGENRHAWHGLPVCFRYLPVVALSFRSILTCFLAATYAYGAGQLFHLVVFFVHTGISHPVAKRGQAAICNSYAQWVTLHRNQTHAAEPVHADVRSVLRMGSSGGSVALKATRAAWTLWARCSQPRAQTIVSSSAACWSPPAQAASGEYHFVGRSGNMLPAATSKPLSYTTQSHLLSHCVTWDTCICAVSTSAACGQDNSQPKLAIRLNDNLESRIAKITQRFQTLEQQLQGKCSCGCGLGLNPRLALRTGRLPHAITSTQHTSAHRRCETRCLTGLG